MGAVNVIVAMGAAKTVGPTFWQEWFNHVLALASQLSNHVFNNVVPLDQQSRGFNLARGMPIADVPGEANQIGSRDGGQFFGFCLDRHEAPIRESQVHTVVEADGLFEIHEEVCATIRHKPFAPQETGVIVQGTDHRICRKRNWPGMDGMCDW